ncbi:hypothetical protein SeLEV6574_g00279 [Synchytrium endobioticum]|uniref:Uncharacterized protein n=1 Tax=Synchytrium endobioticum TaxID=286115 RepID=A0A507DKT3_9FUNG|nr:hypothetical protein SeLEV6574_g00279 [Synchytrium endobioticum]
MGRRCLSHQRIDTTILYQHILQITRAETESVADKSELLERDFRLDGKAFRSRGGMVFDGMISTNGTDVSVFLKHANAHRRGSTRKSKAGLQAEVKQLYIDNHLQELRSTPNIVAIDANKRDILYCQDRNSNNNLRYTSNQRSKETGSRHYRKQKEALRSSHGIDVIDSNIPTHKTMDLQGYCRYLIYRSATTVSGPRQAFHIPESGPWI